MTNCKDCTIYINNFDSKKMTEDILTELFIQVGPVENVTLKEDFAFVNFEYEECVMYACSAMNNIKLFGIPLHVKPRSGSKWGKCSIYTFKNERNNKNKKRKFSEISYLENDEPNHKKRYLERSIKSSSQNDKYSEKNKPSHKKGGFRKMIKRSK